MDHRPWLKIRANVKFTQKQGYAVSIFLVWLTNFPLTENYCSVIIPADLAENCR